MMSLGEENQPQQLGFMSMISNALSSIYIMAWSQLKYKYRNEIEKWISMSTNLMVMGMEDIFP